VPTTTSPVVVDGFVPVVDLSAAWGAAPERAALASVIDAACAESGFLVISGHGVDRGLMDRMYTVTRDFFELSRQEKTRCISPHSGRGFHDGGFVAASYGKKTPPDLCESFSASHLGEPGVADPAHFGEHLANWDMPNVWPDRPADFRTTWLEYYAVMERLAEALMRLFALGLGLPEDFFDDKIDHHISKLFANYYYPQQEPPLPKQLRKGEHTDWGSLTILYQDGMGGLQVKQEGNGWRDVPAIPGTFVINLGDLMQTWTGGRWRSTVHRVLNPVDGRNEARISVPFFHQPNFDAEIEPLPFVPREDGFEPTTSGKWLAAKMRAAERGLS
jgi:isopenicillin N synthase-like dioxygenase